MSILYDYNYYLYCLSYKIKTMNGKQIEKIKYGDYLEIRTPETDKFMTIGRVIHINDQITYIDRKVVWIRIYPTMCTLDKITWDFSYLINYVVRVIEHPSEKKLIKLLYDR